MTISYSGNFCRLLLRWRGSLWQAVYRELTLFLVLYYAVSGLYRLYLSKEGHKGAKEAFEKVMMMM